MGVFVTRDPIRYYFRQGTGAPLLVPQEILFMVVHFISKEKEGTPSAISLPSM